MKKTLVLCICLSMALSMTGCTLGNIVDRFISTGDAPAPETTIEKPRVYMDELNGKLQDFNGSQLTLSTPDNTYVFDVSGATLECSDGMITGDEISIIYEGQLSDTDTTTVKALKVVDEFHKKNRLKDRTAHGQVQGLTANTITIKAKSGKTATYPITGTEQYYQNGIKAGVWVYLHFKGKFSETNSDNPMVLNASHLKVLSISDMDPIKIPEPTPTPVPSEEETQPLGEKQFRGVIQDISLNALQILPEGSDTPLNLDISAIPAYFKGGTAPGSYVNVTYTGEMPEDSPVTLEGITVIAVTGDDPDTLDDRHTTATVTGTIIGSTANTVTIQTNDGAAATCFTGNAQDLSSGGLEPGWGVRITFHPSASKESNIYTAIKIEDA
ncbi:MAG: hypothetical protein Q4D16_08970 [Eubacteriales bacterium]|nr:hypothetical protein [Eubacteriales bacterium]